MYGYRQSMKKPKFLLTLILLVVASFLAGAYLESTAGILQDVTAVTPKIEESLKSFVRERVIFKLNTRAENSADRPVMSGCTVLAGMIRGP